MDTRSKLLAEAISPYAEYCHGYQNPGASGGAYFMGLVLGVGKAEQSLYHEGSQKLDEIVAFDKAEVEETNLGQINMITVSSFCGLNGFLWGYDVVKEGRLKIAHPDLPEKLIKLGRKRIKVYSAAPLMAATKALFGTVTKKNFPLLPGSHVPCAKNSFTAVGPRQIYAAMGVGIPAERNKAACLMMEDVGWMPIELTAEAAGEYRGMILRHLVQSILEVGENQGVHYKEAYVGIKTLVVEQGEVGCALVAAPYFTLAKNAVPKTGVEALAKMNIKTWNGSIQ